MLQRNGIPQVVDLPGVGEHYMGKDILVEFRIFAEHLLDHGVIGTLFHASENSDTLDVLFRDEEAQLERMVNFC